MVREILNNRESGEKEFHGLGFGCGRFICSF